MGYRIGEPVEVTASVALSAVPCTLFGVIVGTDAAGQTIALHDCATVGAAAAGNRKATIKLDTRDDFQFGTEGASFRVGLVAIVSGGAPSVTAVFG